MQNKSNWNPCNTTGKKKPPRKQQRIKLIAQFGFAADPTLSIQHNASITLAIVPTRYYFSRPPNLAFHDFTKKHKPAKKLQSLLGLGFKIIQAPSLMNSWSLIKKSSYHRQFRSINLQFHFAGNPPSEGTTSYDHKLYLQSKWTTPHWRIPPIALEELLSRFSMALNKLFKTRKGKPNLLPQQQR